MEKNHYQSLLRILYKYQTDTMLVYHEGAIEGLVDKNHLEEIMSDLTHARGLQSLPLLPVRSIDELFAAVVKSRLTEDGMKVIPVVDNDARFIGLWNKTEILKKTSQGQDIRKPTAPLEVKEIIKEEIQNNDMVRPENSSENNPAPVIPEITLRKEAQPEPARIPAKIREAAEKKSANPPAARDSRLDDADFISIKTLEALPIPMLALDTRGEILFYNQDWVMLQKKYREVLGVKTLMETAKDLMAKLAFEGKLEVSSVLELPIPMENQILKLRSILGESRPRTDVIGYVFWAEQSPAQESPAPMGSKSRKAKSVEKEKSTEPSLSARYSGRTLVDLLHEEEKRIMKWAMDEAGNNQSNAAMLLGMPRQTFSYRYNKLFSDNGIKKLK